MTGRRFVKADQELLDDPELGTTAKIVYIQLVRFRNRRSGRCQVRDAVIAARLGIGERTVRRARDELRDAGWLEWKQTKGASHYRFPREFPTATNLDTSVRVSDGNLDTSVRTAWTPVSGQRGHQCPEEPEGIELNDSERERGERSSPSTTAKPALADVLARSQQWVTKQPHEWPPILDRLTDTYGHETVAAAIERVEHPTPPKALWSSQAEKLIIATINADSDLESLDAEPVCQVCRGHGERVASDLDENGEAFREPCPECATRGAT